MSQLNIKIRRYSLNSLSFRDAATRSLEAVGGNILDLFKVLVVTTFLSVAFSGCGGTSSPHFDSATTQLLQNTLDAGVSTANVPGAVMAVVGPSGERWVGVNGVSDTGNNTPMAGNLKFRIGSVTKTFTATMILQLVQEGRLALDQTLDAVLPGTGIANADQITVRQLLNHTSGIFDYAQAQNPSFLDGLLADRSRKWTPNNLLAVANANTPYFSPGAEFHYSNTNYVLLGLILEKVTGHTYAEELSTRVLIPLGMGNTSSPATPDMPDNSTRGYTWDGNGWIDTTRFDPSWAFGTGDLISNSDDLLIWLDALIRGTLLDQQRREEMFTFVDIVAGFQYGLGLEKQLGAVGHTGDFVYGGQSAIYHVNGWKVVVLTNASPTNPQIDFAGEYIALKTLRNLGLI